MDVTLLYFDGCPNWRQTAEHLRTLSGELDLTISLRKIGSAEEAEQTGFRGSPTILVQGRDPFASGDEPVGLACRVYQTPHGQAGAPTIDQIRDALT